MTSVDYQLEKHYKSIAERPQRKFEETITSFDRNIFWYNKDDVNRQVQGTRKKITYEDHRKAIEVAINVLGKSTQHDIAMCILIHRYFTDYRNNVFAGKGDFTSDYSFIVKKVGMLFNADTGRVTPINIASKLKDYTEPTLVQINHIAGTVTEVNTPDTGETLNEWAIRFNKRANESTTYHVAGLSLET